MSSGKRKPRDLRATVVYRGCERLRLSPDAGRVIPASFFIQAKGQAMYQELSIREERDIEQERAVARLAKQEAKSHVLDVLAVVEQQLARIRFNVDPGHDGKHLRLPAVEQGESLIEVIREVLPEVISIDYQELVQSTCDDDEQHLRNEEYVIDEVRSFVKYLLGNLKVKP